MEKRERENKQTRETSKQRKDEGKINNKNDGIKINKKWKIMKNIFPVLYRSIVWYLFICTWKTFFIHRGGKEGGGVLCLPQKGFYGLKRFDVLWEGIYRLRRERFFFFFFHIFDSYFILWRFPPPLFFHFLSTPLSEEGNIFTLKGFLYCYVANKMLIGKRKKKFLFFFTDVLRREKFVNSKFLKNEYNEYLCLVLRGVIFFSLFEVRSGLFILGVVGSFIYLFIFFYISV